MLLIALVIAAVAALATYVAVKPSRAGPVAADARARTRLVTKAKPAAAGSLTTKH